MSNWPNGGFIGNTYIDIEDWNTLYFKPDEKEGPHYDNKYVAVLRSVGTGNPGNNTSQSYGDWWFEEVNGHPPFNPATLSPPSISEPLETSAADSQVMTATPFAQEPDRFQATLIDAIDAGLRRNYLVGDEEYGNLGQDYSVGRALRVESTDPEWPSYFLVELMSENRVVAATVVNETPNGLRFGELMAVSRDTRLPEGAELAQSVADAGLEGPARLLWAPTDRGNPRFAPFLAGINPITRSTEILTANGTEEFGSEID